MIRVYQNVPGVLVFPSEQPPASRKLLAAVSEFLRGIKSKIGATWLGTRDLYLC
jgi:hypothetical protein